MNSPASSPRAALLGLLTVLVIPVGTGGCGVERDRLEGIWVLQDFPTEKGQKPCFEELRLEGGQVTSILSCLLKEGTYGQRITSSSYERRETQLTVTANQSSCPDQSRAPVIWLVFADKDKLERTIGNVTTVYQRGTVEIKGITVSGCFDASLQTFDEGPVYTLP
jgi:hypothetical protein